MNSEKGTSLYDFMEIDDGSVNGLKKLNHYVATLTLGSRPREGLVRVRAKKEVRSHISCS